MHRRRDISSFDTLITFGDSYTDETRLGYFIDHQTAPPVGWDAPASDSTASGGYTWARYVADYSGARLYNYAVSGAVCSNDITPRWYSAIDAPFPAVAEYEVPAFLADSAYVESDGARFMSLEPDATVYAMWIGTNDLGNYAFIDDAQVPGTTIPDYVDCVYAQFDRLYDNGARFFVLMNNVPLQLAPMYAVLENGGTGPNRYWPDRSPDANVTETSYRMWEQVVLTNKEFQYRTPFEVMVANRYPGATIVNLDVYNLFMDMYNQPDIYFNSTGPANVTGYQNHCDLSGQNCYSLPDPDSFMWFDPLHKSEQSDRIIAQTFVEAVTGQSDYATYWESE
ncbi:GDSL lipase/acylhydrolase family protein [Lineolata rhizophorae]|uniref:GDSL lipase/acylhydrolase family protein n=1 Tax=Lineolata rhizophorae TaxID=578093 RepID=A0A6A6NUN9_9PEZI|nr:GDSL lipase/acylhydrolase family protein [Lineolata rhizophorae]